MQNLINQHLCLGIEQVSKKDIVVIEILTRWSAVLLVLTLTPQFFSEPGVKHRGVKKLKYDLSIQKKEVSCQIERKKKEMFCQFQHFKLQKTTTFLSLTPRFASD